MIHKKKNTNIVCTFENKLNKDNQKKKATTKIKERKFLNKCTFET